MKPQPIRRRHYTCPECGAKGRSSNKDRLEPTARCPVCGVVLRLQIQTVDGVYTKPCESLNNIEYYI